jgi:hypothetical protein
MRVIRLAAAAILPWFVLSAAHAQGLQPESKQEFQRVFGLSAAPLTSPSLTTPASAALRNSLQQQSG